MCLLTARGNDHCPYIPMLFYRMSLEKTCEEAETGLRMFQGDSEVLSPRSWRERGEELVRRLSQVFLQRERAGMCLPSSVFPDAPSTSTNVAVESSHL
jgi:hypothetical protein